MHFLNFQVVASAGVSVLFRLRLSCALHFSLCFLKVQLCIHSIADPSRHLNCETNFGILGKAMSRPLRRPHQAAAPPHAAAAVAAAAKAAAEARGSIAARRMLNFLEDFHIFACFRHFWTFSCLNFFGRFSRFLGKHLGKYSG